MEIHSECQAQTPCGESLDVDSSLQRLRDLKERLHPIVEAALDLPMQSSPTICLSIKGGAIADPELTARVNLLSSLVLNTKPIDVYVADVAEPFISAGPFNERDLIICRGDESDFTLKRSLFALKSLEGPLQSMAYATSFLVGGIFLIHSGFILGMAVGLGSFWCAHAYSHDTAYLKSFPEDKDLLLAELQKRNICSEEKPKTFVELVQNTATHIFFDIPSAIKQDAVSAYEAPEEEIEVSEEEIPAPEEKPEPTPEPIPETKPALKDFPRRGRGGARG